MHRVVDNTLYISHTTTTMSDSVVDKYSWGSKSPMSVDDWLKKVRDRAGRRD